MLESDHFAGGALIPRLCWHLYSRLGSEDLYFKETKRPHRHRGSMEGRPALDGLTFASHLAFLALCIPPLTLLTSLLALLFLAAAETGNGFACLSLTHSISFYSPTDSPLALCSAIAWAACLVALSCLGLRPGGRWRARAGEQILDRFFKCT